MEILVKPNGVDFPNRLESIAREINIAAENKYGHIVNGRCLDSDGNILRGGLVTEAAYMRTTRNGAWYNVRVTALTGSPAARLAPSGRKGPWACWHSVYAVLEGLYRSYPDMTVRSAFITYHSEDDFLENNAKTFYGRVIANGRSEYFGTLCHPFGFHDWHDAPERRLADGTDLMSL